MIPPVLTLTVQHKSSAQQLSVARAPKEIRPAEGGDGVAAKKGKGRKRTNKKQKRDILRTVCYLASAVLSIVRLAFFFWDRFHK